jgi:hypothetical protein
MISQKSIGQFTSRLMVGFLVLSCAVLLIAGCKNSKTENPEEQVSAVEEAAESTNGDAADTDPKKSVMDHASDLLEQAKDVSTNTTNSASEWAQGVYQTSLEAAGATTKKMNDSLKSLYQKAVESGSTTATSTRAWVEEDISKMGAWVYTSRAVSTEEDPLATVAMLNKMGREKWECFWVDKQGTATTLYFKKSPRSYISSIPFKDLVRMFPGLGSEN